MDANGAQIGANRIRSLGGQAPRLVLLGNACALLRAMAQMASIWSMQDSSPTAQRNTAADAAGRFPHDSDDGAR
jgi:hypothetical protein